MLRLFFKITCVLKIQNNIVLPAKGYYIQNDNNIRLCYIVDDTFQYITLPGKKKAAAYLLKNGIIDGFKKATDGDVILQRYGFSYHKQPDGVLVPCRELKPVAWKDIRLTASDVTLLAAKAEYRRCMKGMPLSGPRASRRTKVISINDYFKKVA